VRLPSAAGNRALGVMGYSYATPSDEAATRRTFANAAVTEVFTTPASTSPLPWKDSPSLGHLMGTLVQNLPCTPLDGLALSLTGPQTRTLIADGSGWFGVVDLPPGSYWLSPQAAITGTTPGVSVTVLAGAVSEQTLWLPSCASSQVYLPLIVR
jgi:hypothetical protein